MLFKSKIRNLKSKIEASVFCNLPSAICFLTPETYENFHGIPAANVLPLLKIRINEIAESFEKIFTQETRRT
jgi:hypothetical protein